MTKPKFDPSAMRDRLSAEIKKQRRTQTEVAEKAGLGHGYLTNILAREQMPSVDKLDALCKELGVSIAWVMYGIEAPEDFERITEVMSRNPKKFYALLALLE
jgi:transcriptional regulator with XRE-family HTH domain